MEQRNGVRTLKRLKQTYKQMNQTYCSTTTTSPKLILLIIKLVIIISQVIIEICMLRLVENLFIISYHNHPMGGDYRELFLSGHICKMDTSVCETGN